MEFLLSMLLHFLYYFALVLEIALFLRAILSWFLEPTESPFLATLTLLTEPAVGLVRGTIGRLFESVALPIDISYIITCVLVEIIRMIIGVYI